LIVQRRKSFAWQNIIKFLVPLAIGLSFYHTMISWFRCFLSICPVMVLVTIVIILRVHLFIWVYYAFSFVRRLLHHISKVPRIYFAVLFTFQAYNILWWDVHAIAHIIGAYIVRYPFMNSDFACAILVL